MKLRSVFYAAVMLTIQDFVDHMRLIFPVTEFGIFVGCGNPVGARAKGRRHSKYQEMAQRREPWVFVWRCV